ncbi:unnamed protein product [Closterium sp. NIES-65]|nr:unnamed protein product [Closterium sp. NIES-65]
MPASRLLAPRAPSALADLTAVMRIHDAPAAAAASYLSPGSVVLFRTALGAELASAVSAAPRGAAATSSAAAALGGTLDCSQRAHVNLPHPTLARSSPPLFPPLSPSFSPPVQRDGSVILRFAPLPDPLAPTAHALSPAPAAPRAERDSIGAPRGGGETPPGGGAAEVRADAGVVAFVTACTSEFSREVPDALIEEIVGLPLRLTPVDHMAKWVAISAHHTVAAINQVIDLPASALHHGSLPSLLHVLGLSKPLLPSAPSSSPSSAPPVVAPTAPFQGGRPTPPPPVPVSAAAALPAQHAPPSAAASIAVTTITGVVLAGLVQFLASFAGLVGRVPGGSSGVGQSRLLWNLPAATVLLLVAAVKVWAAWWHQHHRQQVGAAV